MPPKSKDKGQHDAGWIKYKLDTGKTLYGLQCAKCWATFQGVLGYHDTILPKDWDYGSAVLWVTGGHYSGSRNIQCPTCGGDVPEQDERCKLWTNGGDDDDGSHYKVTPVDITDLNSLDVYIVPPETIVDNDVAKTIPVQNLDVLKATDHVDKFTARWPSGSLTYEKGVMGQPEFVTNFERQIIGNQSRQGGGHRHGGGQVC